MIEPPFASTTLQVTAWLVLPVTVALNACVAPVVSCAVDGVICTPTGTIGAFTVIVTCAEALASATATAFTWKMPATVGAV